MSWPGTWAFVVFGSIGVACGIAAIFRLFVRATGHV